ncbi:MAG: nitroreductase family protein [Anaerolineae bacterium]|nr:nitroreductase family protein [Anaerolineae bacterium]
MELREAIRRRKTTNGPFRSDPVTPEHQKLLIEAASRAPSHFNSQPWRFILIEDEAIRQRIADIGGQTMTQLLEEGRFFQRYRKYFRFSQTEMEERRDGILIDHLPGPLRPFLRQIFSDRALGLMNKLGVPRTLGQDNTRLVATSPLILAVLLTKEEYVPDDLSGYYCLLSMGMAVENIWLTCGDLGLGIQFISTPMEIPEAWAELKSLLQVPDDLELMALYRIGYLPPDQKRPRIDWTSHQRKPLSQLAYRNVVSPHTRWVDDAPTEP